MEDILHKFIIDKLWGAGLEIDKPAKGERKNSKILVWFDTFMKIIYELEYT